jgi:hypothetical protein
MAEEIEDVLGPALRDESFEAVHDGIAGFGSNGLVVFVGNGRVVYNGLTGMLFNEVDDVV